MQRNIPKSSTPKGKTKRQHEQEEWAQQGGYMQAKIQKLINKYAEEDTVIDAKKSAIFQGISIFVNGFTEPSFDALRQIMLDHGGRYEHYYSATRVTHIIATNLAHSKKKAFSEKNVVHPKWVTESVARGSLQPPEKYFLFSKDTLDGFLKQNQSLNEIEDGNVTPASWLSEGGADIAGMSRAQISKQNVYRTPTDDDVIVKESVVTPDLPELWEGDSLLDDAEEMQPPELELSPLEVAEQPKAHDTELIAEKRCIDSSLHQAVYDTMSAGPTAHRKDPMLPADHPDFITQFYSNSRLHHISEWSWRLKDLVNRLRRETSHSLPGRDRLLLKYGRRLVNTAETESDFIHLDMDCFFVSVSLRSYPHLKGKPVVVAHSKGAAKAEGSATNMKNPLNSMSEIACCSYEARKAGLKNGMLMGAGLKLCPDLIAVPYDFPGYSEVSTTLYNTVASYTLDVEAVSCDELYIDSTSVVHEVNISSEDFIRELRADIISVTGCPVSAGLGPNLLLARLATRKGKPNGQFRVNDDVVSEFMSEQMVRDLPGIGRAIGRRLVELGAQTCAQLQNISLGKLQAEFGPRTGEQLYNLCRGIDKRSLRSDQVRQSVSCDINYGIRLTNSDQVEIFLLNIAKEVADRLAQAMLRGKQVTLKLKVRRENAPVQSAKFMGHGICDNITKSGNLPRGAGDAQTIFKQCMSLYNPLRIKPCDLRGVGVQVTKLEPITKISNPLFRNFIGTKSVQNVTSTPQKTVNATQHKDFRNKSDCIPRQVVMHPPDLCGSVTEQDVCGLLDRWLSFSRAPVSKDINRVSDYLKLLVSYRDLPAVDRVIRHLYYATERLRSATWTAGYQSIVTAVDKTVKAEYGASMRLPGPSKRKSPG